MHGTAADGAEAPGQKDDLDSSDQSGESSAEENDPGIG